MFKLFITKVIIKLLSFKKNKVFYSNKSITTKKKALFSYVMIPSANHKLPFFFQILHNRYFQCKLMVEVLNEAGFDVYLYDYLCPEVNTTIDYDIFIGHNRSFYQLTLELNPTCKNVLLTTGCSPEFDNNQLFLRNQELQKRKNTKFNFYAPIENYQYALENCKAADSIFMIWSLFIKDNGWYSFTQSKSYLYNNVTSIHPKIKKNKTGNFVYMSSVGQLRRGLDLLLDAFYGRKEKLYVCAPYEKEPDFIKYFDDTLSNSKNIILMGFVNQDGIKFKQILDDADFAILPSCSEGQSGSIVTLMGHGLIPIIADNVGIENIDDIGIKIKGFTVEDIKEVLEKAKELKEIEIEYKRKLIFEEFVKYSPSYFKTTFHTFLKKIQLPEGSLYTNRKDEKI